MIGEGDMRQKQKNIPIERQVASINTDYVRSVQRQVTHKKSKKIRLFKRLSIFGVLSVIIIGFFVSTLINSKSTLEEKKLQKEQVTEELAKVQEEQEILKLQISKLNDDEYIGKLLRKEYFLSEEGEIIFTLPDKEEK